MLRLIDANLDRIGEGLRLLEDVARFILNDPHISAELKSLRHELAVDDPALQKALLQARDSAGDVAAFAEEVTHRQNLQSVIIANSKRVEESLRVVEEFAKLPEVTLDSSRFKKARFDLYQIEKNMVSRLLRQDKRIAGLYVIIDPEALGQRDELEVCRQAIDGGAKVIQFRDKKRGKGEILTRAGEMKEVCAQFGVLFILNDYLDIAIAADADGLHLGPGDLPISTARQLLPIDRILGRSTTTLEEALRAEADGADYVAVGSIYPTASKAGAIVVGLERLRQIRAAISIPIVAIGGINEKNAAEMIQAGADSLAVISAVLGADDVTEAARRLAEMMEVT